MIQLRKPSQRGKVAKLILITRPAPEGEPLCQKLHEKGLETLWLPTLAFAPPDKPCEDALRQLDQYDWLIFISREAVRQSLPHLPSGCQIAAIGKGTAKLLEAEGYSVFTCPDLTASAEALLSLSPFQNPAGQRIAILKGQGGRKEPARTLCARGAEVTEIMLYQRICPVPDNLPACRISIQQHLIHAVQITSGDGLINLLRLTGNACRAALLQIPLIVISPRLQRLAARLGFTTIQLAANPGEDAMINALHTIFLSGKPE